MDTQELVPNRPTVQDASAVIGILVEISADLGRGLASDQGVEDEAGPDLASRMGWRLEQAGLVPPDADAPLLALAIKNLSQRMRYVLGEFASPPEPDISLTDHNVWFWSSRARDAFLRDIHRLHLPVRTPKRRLRARVTVMTTELLGSDQFETREAQIEEAARRHGGHYSSWTGP